MDGSEPSTIPLTDPQIEEAILCSILRDARNLDRIGDLTADDFSDPVYAEMFGAMQTLREEKLPINTINLRGKGITSPMAREAIDATLAKLSFAGELPNVADMSRQVVDLSLRRQMMEMSQRYGLSAGDGSETVPALASSLRTELDTLVSRLRSGKRRLTHKEATSSMLKELDRDLTGVLVKTGISSLDAMLGGGLRRGDYAVLGGRPGAGKSTLALAVAVGAAKGPVDPKDKKRSHGVLYFTPEMTIEQLALRAACANASTREFRVPYELIMSGSATEFQWRRFMDANPKDENKIRALPILYDGDTNLLASEMHARVKQAAVDLQEMGFTLDLVIVDHMGKVRPTNRYKGNKVQEVGEVSEAMAAIAKEENVAVLALHQLSRNVEGRDNKRPQLSDLRNSGDVEQDADIVMFAYRAAYYLTMKPEDEEAEAERMRTQALAKVENDLEVLVGKNRRGKTGMQKLYCDVGCNLVGDPLPDKPAPVISSAAKPPSPPATPPAARIVTYSSMRRGET